MLLVLGLNLDFGLGIKQICICTQEIIGRYCQYQRVRNKLLNEDVRWDLNLEFKVYSLFEQIQNFIQEQLDYDGEKQKER